MVPERPPGEGIVAVARSERGWGSCPASTPVVGEGGGTDGVTDWTVANVFGEPPPKSKVGTR